MKRRGCFCLRQGYITDDQLPYDKPIAPYGLDGYIADRGCGYCKGTGYQQDNKLKILFIGDAACSTGFALCTHQLCDRLYASGHDVTVLGINHYGSPHDYLYAIYPCVDPLDRSLMVCGEQRLPKLIARLKPDVVIILQDPWNIRGYMIEIEEQLGDTINAPRPLMIGWLAVDAKNQISGKQLNQLDHVVTWTQFGIDELRAGGYSGNHSIIGLGVDTSIYWPIIDQILARQSKLSDGTPVLPEGIPLDSFIVGMVGRNQARKRIDLALEYFAEWIKSRSIDNAYLYLHVGPTGETGCDIQALCRYYGIKVIVSSPPVSSAVTVDDMRLIYNCFDVLWSTSQGEGWGLCVSPDTLIQTPSGVQPMRDIKTGDEVMTQNGSFKSVKNKVSRYAEVLKVKASGLPALSVTPEHPFLVLDKKSDPRGYFSRHPMSPGWKMAQEVEIGDFLACPRPKWDATLPEHIDLCNYLPSGYVYDDEHVWHPSGFSPYQEGRMSLSQIQNRFGVNKYAAESAVRGTTKRGFALSEGSLALSLSADLALPKPAPIKVNRYIRLDDRVLSFIGWYLAEGSIDGDGTRVSIDLHAKERGVANELSITVKESFGIHSVLTLKRNNSCGIRICSRVLAKFLESLCGNGARKKELCPLLWQSADSLSYLVRAYLLGDGHYRNGKWLVTTASRNLAWQLRSVLASAGIFASIVWEKRNDHWTLIIAGDAADRLGTWTGLQTRQIRSRRSAMTALASEDFIFVPVRKVIDGGRAEVMDIQVDQVHSFVGNGAILHNTTLEAMACGIPTLVPDWSGLGDWAKDAAMLVPCTSTALCAPINRAPYTIGGIADKVQTIEALDKLYRHEGMRSKLSQLGLDLARKLSWDVVGEQWEGLLQSLWNAKHHPVMTDSMISTEAIGAMDPADFALTEKERERLATWINEEEQSYTAERSEAE